MGKQDWLMAHWQEVLRANMSKVKAEVEGDGRSKRDAKFDIVKPKGWVGPNHQKVIDENY